MDNDKPSLNVVVVGHVDHGKSTLLGRLIFDAGLMRPEKVAEVKKTSQELGEDFEFAYFLDNVREEREQHKTIDVFYTLFETDRFKITFIDAPGHRELLRNMLTGASQADAAILVVSSRADEGVREQTRRHLLLVDFLGIKQLLVAVSKMDAVSYSEERFLEIKQDVQKLLSSFGFDPGKVSVVPLSAREGDNVFFSTQEMLWFKEGPLVKFLDRVFVPPQPLSKRPLRVSVQDMQELDGEELIIGKIETGISAVGQRLVFQPSETVLVIGELKTFAGGAVEEAGAGEMVALKPQSPLDHKLERGEVGGKEKEPPEVVTEFKAKVFVLADKLLAGEEVLLRCGLAERKCLIQKISPFGDLAKTLLKPERPLVVENFSEFPPLGRFTLRQQGKTVAVGTYAKD